MNNRFFIIVLVFLISCNNQAVKIDLASFTHMEGTSIELCFEQNLDGYQYELELITNSGKHIINEGILNKGYKSLDSTVCYNIVEPLLPHDTFNKATRLKTLLWKIFDPETKTLLNNGEKDIEVRRLMEYLEEQSGR